MHRWALQLRASTGLPRHLLVAKNRLRAALLPARPSLELQRVGLSASLPCSCSQRLAQHSKQPAKKPLRTLTAAFLTGSLPSGLLRSLVLNGQNKVIFVSKTKTCRVQQVVLNSAFFPKYSLSYNASASLKRPSKLYSIVAIQSKYSIQILGKVIFSYYQKNLSVVKKF